MEIVGAGHAAAAPSAPSTPSTNEGPADDNTSFVGGLAQALGVRGFDRQQGRPLLDPRDALGSAMATRLQASSTPPVASAAAPAAPPLLPSLRSSSQGAGAGSSKEDVRAKYLAKLKARTAGKGAGGEEDEAARRTRARRLVEVTERRGKIPTDVLG